MDERRSAGTDMADDGHGGAREDGGRAFLRAVVAAAVFAAVVGVGSEPPVAPAPAYALESEIVYRVQVAVAVFGMLYAVVVLVRLASHGLTPSRVGTAVVDLPQVVDGLYDARTALSQTNATAARLSRALDGQSARLARIEDMLGAAEMEGCERHG